MKKNDEQLQGRIALVQLCFNNPKEGAEYLIRAAETLMACQTSDQRIKCLMDVLFLSERTVFRDLAKENTDTTELQALAS